MEAGAGWAQALWGSGTLVPSPLHARWGAQRLRQPPRAGYPRWSPAAGAAGGAETAPPECGGPGWGGGQQGGSHPPSRRSSTSRGAEVAEAKHRFPMKRVYLAPALLTPKQEGLKVNSLSIPYCQPIRHRGGQGLPKLSQPPRVREGDGRMLCAPLPTAALPRWPVSKRTATPLRVVEREAVRPGLPAQEGRKGPSCC